ncbi:flagellar motor switch protein FliY [Campylobacter sp. RM9344]|uniref:Flagellar motor switch protein FliN n=1 Tax=Campylobacter californiensis TaxID=1032243 RepID=A0AAW3ZVP2_9BACT|nr:MULTISPECIES: flagellar motor switch protein FliY [unclassified Campylobacter]MBE2984370.1 flagellar motor switch protein FliY [Campylobacter sp. RM6883]MBE2985708.1 flagellar motor switch protein FliY [Campylobacter sp. RM12919]MBE2988772.1 flagellar motor switch protein FliY [Campylobacter sp. RM12920]MBE2995805.1 flagellar motor switch protein FliY [Campylobacter sp. RM6913]MBE3029636.1 flagellar motor switch protein FliY [Campylobacter sp. RM9344]
MMNNFFNLFTNELKATIEGLTGRMLEVGERNDFDASSQNGIKPPVAIANIMTKGDISAKIAIVCTPVLISAVGEWMMGEEEISRNENLGVDELDAAKEIFSNLLGAFSTSLGAQKELPKLGFDISSVSFLDENSNLDLSGYEKLFLFNVNIDEISEGIGIACDQSLMNILDPRSQEQGLAQAEAPSKASLKSEFSAEEMRNIGLIMDVRLPIRVRIGSKRMLLKDVLTMDIGSVIELNQLANDPLEILIGDKVIAVGEVVIIDGNFGIQITQIGSKRERLQQLK